MPEPIPDTELMREVLALIEADPAGFDASRFASTDPEGAARFDFGGRTIVHLHPKARWQWKQDFQRAGWQLATAVDVRNSRRPAGRSAYYLAMELLNIGFNDARLLFADNLTVPELRPVVDHLCTVAADRT